MNSKNPEATSKSGNQTGFKNLRLSNAGEVNRPDEFSEAVDISKLAFNLIRVLDDDHQAVGPWDPELAPRILRNGLRHMLLTRIFDDRMLMMQRQGRLSFYVKSTGEEAVSAAQCLALKPDDMMFPTYRQQGLLLAREVPPQELICQLLSNSGDRLKGMQLPVMYSNADVNFFAISGTLATQFSQAVGWAMASTYKGDDNLACAWVGEGGSAEPDFHYALTFSSVYKSPVILNVVNNQWAISTDQSIAGGRYPFAARGTGYGIPGLRVDGNDFLAVYAVTQWAAKRARAGHGPTLIELFTYRADAHSTSDDPGKYRPKDEWKHWPLGDPLDRLKQHLIYIDEWSEEQHTCLLEELNTMVVKAWEEAESLGNLSDGPWPPTTAMFDYVYKEMPVHLQKQRQELLEE
jgi:2-oxoisovalerate dehydrogenase E1 component subunit alpha